MQVRAIFGVHAVEAKNNRFATDHIKTLEFHPSNTKPLIRRKCFSVVVSKRATHRSVTGRTIVSSQNR
jgi:hypothetical protein